MCFQSTLHLLCRVSNCYKEGTQQEMVDENGPEFTEWWMFQNDTWKKAGSFGMAAKCSTEEWSKASDTLSSCNSK